MTKFPVYGDVEIAKGVDALIIGSIMSEDQCKGMRRVRPAGKLHV
jgi:hypothetical protein